MKMMDWEKLLEDSTTCIDKQTSTVTTPKKRAKLGNRGSDLMPAKKSKPGIASDDQSVSNDGQSKEASNMTVGQTFDEDDNLSSGKKKKREKSVEAMRHMASYERKKGRLSADSRRLRTLAQAAGDLIHTATPSIVKGKHVNTSPIRVVMGLQCYAATISQSNKSKQLASESPQKAVEPETPQSGVPLSPKTTGNQETDGETIIKRKSGRQIKGQPKNKKTSLAVHHQNGIDLTLQQEKYDKSQDSQDSPAQKENGNSEINVEKSLDTVSDDQPLSRWFLGNHCLATPKSTGRKPTNVDGQPLTFEKRSSLWAMLESMEAFSVIPQKPHFRPLDNAKESARERLAINKMVDFSGVFEDTLRLQIDHPRTEIEDRLETLSELDTHGFDVSLLRNRLMEFISIKDKWEELERRSKDIKCNIENQRVNVQRLDKEIESIDKQVRDLLKTRDRVLKEKERTDLEILASAAEISEIESGMNDILLQIR